MNLHKRKDIFFTSFNRDNFTEDSVDGNIENEIWQFMDKV